MGINEAEKYMDQFQRTSRRCAAVLDAPNLFSGATKIDTVVLARPLGSCPLTLGGSFLMRLTDGEIHLVDGVSVVGVVVDPPDSVVDSIRGIGCDHALGVVVGVFESSGIAEIKME